MTCSFLNSCRPTHCARTKAFHRRLLVDIRFFDIERIHIRYIMSILSICDPYSHEFSISFATPGESLRISNASEHIVPESYQSLIVLYAETLSHIALLTSQPYSSPRFENHRQTFYRFVVFSVFPCPRYVRVGENSPSLCPTIFSVTYTGINRFPL